jgi:hypothetical protein
MKSPVDFFRELLAMTPAERNQALTNRTPENRRLILAKIREYLSLKDNERELRLQATELEWRLLPLMRQSAPNRAAQLAAMQEGDRKMVEPRLQEWDRLPDNVKKDFLERRESIRLFIQMTATTNQAPPLPLNLTGAHPAALEERIKQLQAMTEAERQQLLGRFNRFFDLSESEKQQALRKLSVPEQAQIARTLHKFDGLTPLQRMQCVRSFEQFASMTLAERQQFLKNAERWILMTPDQRKAWREVVEKVSTTPPTFNLMPHPPAPPPPSRTRPATVVTTNHN